MDEWGIDMISDVYDLCVIGGGINGAGIARDAAGRGLKVLLVEKGDLACATSSASTKFIHGGLRYLEYFEFRLVREALQEREVLLRMAPHIIWPLEFVLPYEKRNKLRPFWMIRAGLFLYDHLAKRRTLGASYGVNLAKHPYGVPLDPRFGKGFCYADCWVDDARLVVLNAMDAREQGADVLTYTECVGMQQDGDEWMVRLRDVDTGDARNIRASMVVNAAGPWVREFLDDQGLAAPDVPSVRLVKGSHIIVRKQYEGEQVYILQQNDGRVVFAIPYEDDFTLIGTTEVDYEGDAMQASISDEEVVYLCDAYNAAFSNPVSVDDVLSSYSGVRPLFDDGDDDASAVTRDYHLHDHVECPAPLVSVFGGKITTYRVLAQEVVDLLLQKSGRRLAAWTSGSLLPGGDISDDFCMQQNDQYQWLEINLLNRYLRLYGSRIEDILDNALEERDLGVCYGDGVYEAEVSYLIRNEWARTVEDVLWRRTKLGLHITEETQDRLAAAFPDLLEKYRR